MGQVWQDLPLYYPESILVARPPLGSGPAPAWPKHWPQPGPLYSVSAFGTLVPASTICACDFNSPTSVQWLCFKRAKIHCEPFIYSLHFMCYGLPYVICWFFSKQGRVLIFIRFFCASIEMIVGFLFLFLWMLCDHLYLLAHHSISMTDSIWSQFGVSCWIWSVLRPLHILSHWYYWPLLCAVTVGFGDKLLTECI